MDYTIKQGDNLTNIAKANNTTIADIAKLNNIQNPNLIKAGTTLKLSAPTTPIATTNPATSNVNADILSNVQKVQLPQAPAQSTLTVPLSLADKAIQDTQVQLTDSQKTQDNLISKQMEAILGMNSMGTEAGVKQDELNKLGYQQKLQDYNTLNSQILTKQAELNQSDIQLISNMRAEEKRDTLLPFAQMGQAKLQGDAAIMRALKTSEIGVLNAQVLAKQGDIQMAQQVAQDAVDAKFAPYKQQIQTYTDLLKAIDPILTRDEKKQANEQKIRTEIALKEIDKLSKAQSDALSAAISNNAPQSVLNAINSAQSINDITKVGSNWIISRADKLDQQLKQAQIANQYASLNKTNTEISSLNKGGTTKPATDTQITNAGYASRIELANKVIDSNPDVFNKMNYAQFKLIESNNPLANKLLSPAQQQAAQAMRSFITAKLRKESGAAISPTEFSDARKTYFPQLGDSQEVLLQKKATRDLVLQNNIQGAGQAYQSNSLDDYLSVVDKVTSPSQSKLTDYINSLSVTKK